MDKTRWGHRRTHREIADYAGCSYQNIYLIEVKALKKLRTNLRFRNDPVLRDLMATLFPR